MNCKKNKYNILPNQYVTFKALIGDSCDNISGISGIGNITASKILKYGTIEDFIKKSDNLKIINLIESNIDKINKNEKLILLNNTINTSQTVFKPLSEQIFKEKVHDIINTIELS